MLPPELVLQLASKLTLEDGAFVVGGQALNLWAERYAGGVPELARFRPFTSKDIDYYGHLPAAEKLAETLGGTVRVPDPDDHSPNSAIVVVRLQGKEVVIDFISDVLGVRRGQAARQAMELVVPIRANDVAGELPIPILHPVHCLQSRVANVSKLGRNDDVARRQLQAAPLVVAGFVDEMLRLGEHREACRTLKMLGQWLEGDGRTAHEIGCDALPVLERFSTDERLDERFRNLTLGGHVNRVVRYRAGR